MGLHINNSDTINILFSDLQTYFENIIINAKKITLQAGSNQHALEIILKNENQFLIDMNKIVYQYNKENKKKSKVLINAMIIIAAFILLILFLQAKFLAIPTINKEKKSYEIITKKSAELKEKNDELIAIDEKLTRNNKELLAMNVNMKMQKIKIEKSNIKLKGQASLGQILRKTTQPNFELNAFLQTSLEILLKLPWLGLEAKGSVFLTNEAGNLKMVAQKNLGVLVQMCNIIKPEQCLCGKALSRKKLLFSNCVEHDHDIRPEGMTEHGHYNIPLMFEEKVSGVLNLYVGHKHKKKYGEEEFLKSIADIFASVIERTYLEKKLKKQNTKLQENNIQLNKYFTAIEQSTVVITFTNMLGKIEYVNPQFVKLTGYTLDEIKQNSANLLKSGKTPPETYHDLWKTI